MEVIGWVVDSFPENCEQCVVRFDCSLYNPSAYARFKRCVENFMTNWQWCLCRARDCPLIVRERGYNTRMEVADELMPSLSAVGKLRDTLIKLEQEVPIGVQVSIIRGWLLESKLEDELYRNHRKNGRK